jgi:hypothetical protein
MDTGGHQDSLGFVTRGCTSEDWGVCRLDHVREEVWTTNIYNDGAIY